MYSFVSWNGNLKAFGKFDLKKRQAVEGQLRSPQGCRMFQNPILFSLITWGKSELSTPLMRLVRGPIQREDRSRSRVAALHRWKIFHSIP